MVYSKSIFLRIQIVACLCVIIGGWGIISEYHGHHDNAVNNPGMCGPSSLFFIARHYGLNVTYANILKLEPQRDNETSFADLKTMADKLHLCSYGIQTTLAEIKLSKPIGILHVDNNHFVALIGYSIDGVIVDDINSKTNSVENIWSFSTLSHRWDGRLLIIKLAPKSL